MVSRPASLLFAACLLFGVQAFGLPPRIKSLPKVTSRGLAASGGVAPLGSSAANPLDTALSTTGGETTEASKQSALTAKLKIGSYFALWYAFNIFYNIFNKQALNALDLPWTLALVQLFAGIPYVTILWMSKLRKAPKLSRENLVNLSPSALCHLGTHVGAVLSLGAGAVSFTHIVKASEPVVSAGLTAIFLKQIMPLPVYLSLVPIIGGVALASVTELSFTWLAFGAAMMSNVASASRAILSKTVLSGKPMGENLTPQNLYAVLTILSFFMLLPMSLAFEAGSIQSVWNAAVASGLTPKYLALTTAASGIFYYLYNEVAFLALDSVAPVTHAVGNTIKRVVIILASIVVFNTQLTPLGAAGSGIAIAGTLMYSLAKNKFK